MNSEDCCKIMEEAGVKPTSIRILVYKTISTLNNTFNLNDIETLLPSVDKSSIFRVLRTFHNNNLIHSIDDGSGSQKYCFVTNTEVVKQKTDIVIFIVKHVKRHIVLKTI